MKTVFSLLGWLYNIYPIKIYLRKRVVGYFLTYHISGILRKASRAYVVSESIKLEELMKEPAFRGLITEIIKPNDFYPSPKDFAIAINIALNNYCNDEQCHQSKIIDLAYHISREIKERIVTDQVLKSIFSDMNKEVNKLPISFERTEIEECFNNKKKLFLNYFSSFNDPQFGFGIKIWHQGEGIDWIEWAEKDSITINLDPLKIREGFFLSGFDYEKATSSERLTVATRRDGYEYFNDFENENEIIWLR